MRILFIASNWSKIADPIIDEMVYQGHDVTFLEHSEFPCFRYYNFAHKISLKITSVLSGVNCKRKHYEENIENFFKGFVHKREKFDYVFLTNPDIFNQNCINLIKNISDKIILILWDSLSRMPQNNRNIELFDKIYSFDKTDISQHNFIPITNFFKRCDIPLTDNSNLLYDVFSILSFDKKRYKKAIRLVKENPNLTFKIMFFIDHKRKRKFIDETIFDIIDKPIFNTELLDLISKSKSILDIGYENQSGLSFRIFECIAWHKKNITTNYSVRQYDFYHPSNFFVCDDSYEIDPEFIQSPYVEIDDQLKNKYRIDSWVRYILEND